MLVSTFELLVVPITPVGPPALARTIVQGYFLTVANTSAVNARLRLTFKATTPNLDILKTVVIRDVTNNDNVFGELVATANPAIFNYDFGLPANETALIILQPDVTIRQILTDKNLEIRGYVEINQRRSEGEDIDVLLTPEHRGTFFSGTADAPGEDIDQLVYALPTALGKAQYTLPPVGKSIVKEVADNTSSKPIQEGVEIPKRIQDGVAKVPDLPDPKSIAEAPSIPNLQEILLQMAQRVDELTAAAEQGSAFIQAGERPAVGTQVLSATGNGR
jgi:hypothetical protein